MDFTDLFERQGASLTRALVLAGASPADAADYVAEAFARAWERWDRVQAMDRPDLWVTRVAFNVKRRAGRRRSIELRLLRTGYAAEVDSGGTGASAFWEVIRQLPPRQRTAIALRYYQGLTERECAEAMGVRPGTVAATLSHARASLAVALTGPRDAEIRQVQKKPSYPTRTTIERS